MNAISSALLYAALTIFMIAWSPIVGAGFVVLGALPFLLSVMQKIETIEAKNGTHYLATTLTLAFECAGALLVFVVVGLFVK